MFHPVTFRILLECEVTVTRTGRMLSVTTVTGLLRLLLLVSPECEALSSSSHLHIKKKGCKLTLLHFILNEFSCFSLTLSHSTVALIGAPHFI